MPFVRYVPSFLRWNDLFSPRLCESPTHLRLQSFECFPLAVFIHTLCYLGYIHEGNSHVQLQEPLCTEITKLSFSYSWDVLNFLSALKCFF